LWLESLVLLQASASTDRQINNWKGAAQKQSNCGDSNESQSRKWFGCEYAHVDGVQRFGELQYCRMTSQKALLMRGIAQPSNG
jgi:hypothetical protein